MLERAPTATVNLPRSRFKMRANNKEQNALIKNGQALESVHLKGQDKITLTSYHTSETGRKKKGLIPYCLWVMIYPGDLPGGQWLGHRLSMQEVQV